MSILRPGSEATRSADHFRRASKRLAGGVGSFARGLGAGYTDAPVVVDTAAGSRLRDLDGREYIDYLLALGPLILGHRPEPVLAAVTKAMQRWGSMPGLSYELEAEAAEAVCQLVPNAQLVRFSNSGTEAVAMALRVARVATGRPLIVKFEGHFHGWSDSIHWSVRPQIELAGNPDKPTPVAAVSGLPFTAESVPVIVLPWNRPDLLTNAFDRSGPSIAAVICEPMMANCGCVGPQEGFLSFIRDLTRQHGSLLIFDEVVTGFRLAPGGAQTEYGVVPDLATFAKAIGAGFAVSALAGSEEALACVADGSLPYLGTYNTNVPAMAAVVATLETVAEPTVLASVNEVGMRLARGLQSEFMERDIPVTVGGFGSVFQLWFADHAPRDYREAVSLARVPFFRRFHNAMRARGVLFHPSQFEHFFVSTAHSQDDVDQTLEIARDAIREVAPSFPNS